MIKKLGHAVGVSVEDRIFFITERINELIDAVNKPKEEWLKNGDEYFTIDSTGYVCEIIWNDSQLAKNRKDFGNCFRTKEESESARDKVKELLKSLQK